MGRRIMYVHGVLDLHRWHNCFHLKREERIYETKALIVKRTLNITEKFTSFNIDKINFLLQQNKDQRMLLCKYFYLFCFCDFFSYRKDHFEAVFSYFCSAFSIFCVLSFRQAPSSTAILC